MRFGLIVTIYSLVCGFLFGGATNGLFGWVFDNAFFCLRMSPLFIELLFIIAILCGSYHSFKAKLEYGTDTHTSSKLSVGSLRSCRSLPWTDTNGSS